MYGVITDWLNLIQCPICFGRLRHDSGGVFCCCGCSTPYASVGNVLDLLKGSGDAIQEVEVDYDYDHPRCSGRLRRLYNDNRRLFELQLIRREADRLDRPLDVLDIGCGDPTRPSSYHARIRPLTRVYLGMDPSLPIGSHVRPLPGVGVVRANGELRVVRDGVVDVVLCFSALDHCVDPDRVLANMVAALRPGGCTLIDLKNLDAWYRAIYDRLPGWLARRLAPDEHTHEWNFSPNDLARRLEAAGFHEVESYDFFYLTALLRSQTLDWVLGLLGEQWCATVLRLGDRVGRFIASRRGGIFITLARKPGR